MKMVIRENSKVGRERFEPPTAWRYHPHFPFFSIENVNTRVYLLFMRFFQNIESDKKDLLRLGTAFNSHRPGFPVFWVFH